MELNGGLGLNVNTLGLRFRGKFMKLEKSALHLVMVGMNVDTLGLKLRGTLMKLEINVLLMEMYTIAVW